jgi:hypothetical protein
MGMTPEIRKAYADTLEAQAKWQCALTLVYNEWPVSMDRIKQDLRGLHRMVDRQLLGRRFHLRPMHERSQMWAVVEKSDTYAHVHAAWKLPPPHGISELKRMLDGGLWLTFAPNGGYDCQEYKSGWSGYATKSLQDTTDIIDSADFLRR